MLKVMKINSYGHLLPFEEADGGTQEFQSSYKAEQWLKNSGFTGQFCIVKIHKTVQVERVHTTVIKQLVIDGMAKA